MCVCVCVCVNVNRTYIRTRVALKKVQHAASLYINGQWMTLHTCCTPHSVGICVCVCVCVRVTQFPCHARMCLSAGLNRNKRLSSLRLHDLWRLDFNLKTILQQSSSTELKTESRENMDTGRLCRKPQFEHSLQNVLKNPAVLFMAWQQWYG